MLKKLTIRMNKPFDYGDIVAIARSEAKKKEHTKENVRIVDVVCEEAEFTVYYDVQKLGCTSKDNENT